MTDFSETLKKAVATRDEDNLVPCLLWNTLWWRR